MKVIVNGRQSMKIWEVEDLSFFIGEDEETRKRNPQFTFLRKGSEIKCYWWEINSYNGFCKVVKVIKVKAPNYFCNNRPELMELMVLETTENVYVLDIY